MTASHTASGIALATSCSSGACRRLRRCRTWHRAAAGSTLILLLSSCYAGVIGSSARGHDDGNDGADGENGREDGNDDGGGVGGETVGDSSSEEGDTTGEPSGSCVVPQPGKAPIRRLSAFEYDNTIEDLLGDTSHPSQAFPQEGAGGFDNNADVASVSRLQAEKYMGAAEDIAARATEDVSGLLGCDLAGDETGCVRSWIATFGARAWRRPLAEDEVTVMMATYTEVREQNDARESVALVLQAFLQSPHFLYRVEFGVPSTGADVLALTDWELASRLSYFLWSSLPDDELFAAAAAGELNTPKKVEAQARRMLDHPRARTMVRHFNAQWLELHGVEGLTKDADLFPDYGPDIVAAQHAEINAFLDHVMWEGEGTVEALLTAPYTFVDDALAGYYGLPAPVGTGMQQVTPDDREVVGVLSQGAILSVQARPYETNPIARGLFVRRQLLCTTPPPPPDDVDITPPEVDPGATTRERYSQHRADPACSGCHQLMDPVGFGFENFDATGRWRTTENGLPVDASGQLIGTDVDGTFIGVRELGDRLASSEVVTDCIVTQWFRFGYGRTESYELDACTLDDLKLRFAEADHDVRELLVALTQTDAFLSRPATQGDP